MAATRTVLKGAALLGLFTACAASLGCTIELAGDTPLTLAFMVPIDLVLFIVCAAYAEWLINGADPTEP